MGIKVSAGFCSRMVAASCACLVLFMTVPAIAQDMLKEMRSNVIEKINGKDYYIHTIKKGQTLYMISKAYGADVNEVIRENPEVKEGIKADQKIRIPVSRAEELPKKYVKPIPPKPKENSEPVPKTDVTPKNDTQVPAEPAPAIEPPPISDLPCGMDKVAKKDTYNIALMLPLYLNEAERIDAENPPEDPKEEYRSLRFLQFYEGFLAALDSLRKTGLSANVYIYDVGKDSNSTKKLMRNPELEKMDLIVGLLYQWDFHVVSEFAKRNRIPIVNPVTERVDILEGNPMVIKAMPSLKTRIPELALYLSEAYPDGNIIIIRDIQYREKEEPEKLATITSEKNMQVHLVDGYGRAFEFLSKEKDNILVAFTLNKVFAIELVTKLNEFRNDYNLTLFGMPKWDEIDGLDPEYLVNLNTHMMTQSFVDYTDPEVKKFVIRFQDEYKIDPNHLAFQGFDIAFYFSSALFNYGKALQHCISGFRMRSLQNDFEFLRDKGNGYENQHWAIYKYENYQVRKVARE